MFRPGLLHQFEGYFSLGFPALLRDTELLGALLEDLPACAAAAAATTGSGASGGGGAVGGRRECLRGGAAKQLKDVKTDLDRCGLDLLMYTPKWLICLFLNTLPGHVAVRIWDLVFWHNASHGLGLVPPAAGPDAGAAGETTPESELAPESGGNGVLLWVCLAVLKGQGASLAACRDFEQATLCLKQGLDRLQSFAWIKRHAPLPLDQCVATVIGQCAAREKAVARGETFVFGAPCEPGALGASGGGAPNASTGLCFKDLARSSLGHTHSGGGGGDGSSSASAEGGTAWYQQCVSERALVVGLSCARAQAAELRLADDAHAAANAFSASAAGRHDALGGSSSGGVGGGNDAGARGRAAVATLRALAPRGPSGDVSAEDDGFVILSGDLGCVAASDDENDRCGDDSDDSNGGETGGTGREAKLRAAKRFKAATASSAATFAGAGVLEAVLSGGGGEAVRAIVHGDGLHRRPLPESLRKFLALVPLPTSSSPSSPWANDGERLSAGAYGLLRAFASAYAELQRCDPSSCRDATREAQATASLLAASAPQGTTSSYEPASAEATFLLACAGLLLSAHLHPTAAHSAAAPPAPGLGKTMSPDAFVKHVGVVVGLSGAYATSGGGGGGGQDASALEATAGALYRSVAAYPLVGSKPGAHHGGAGPASGLESALSKINTWFPPSASKAPRSQASAPAAAPTPARAFLRTLFTGTPAKQLAPDSGGSRTKRPRGNGGDFGGDDGGFGGGRNAEDAGRRGFSDYDDALEDGEGGNFPETAEALMAMMAVPASVRKPWSRTHGHDAPEGSTAFSGATPRRGSDASGWAALSPPPSSSHRQPLSSAARSPMSRQPGFTSPEAIEMQPTPRRKQRGGSSAKPGLFGSPLALEMHPTPRRGLGAAAAASSAAPPTPSSSHATSMLSPLSPQMLKSPRNGCRRSTAARASPKPRS